MALTLAKTLRLLAAEKKAVLQRQAALVASLNKMLPTIGYRVVPISAEGRADVRPTGVGRRRQTPAMATNRPLVCQYCNRTFALPLHLGRHISVMHKAKRAVAMASPSPAGSDGAAAAAKPARAARGRRASTAARRRRRVTSARGRRKASRRTATGKSAKG